MLKPKTFSLPQHYPEETQNILYWFEAISQIPRKSKQEKALKNWLRDFAKVRKLVVKEDAAGNLLISKGGTPGMEKSPAVILQGHLDMVCEKTSSSPHNFDKDPICLKYYDGWVMANETSLGADNGIAIAIMLCLLDSTSYAHPPLECLMTVDEETGLTGALGLEKNFLTGKTLINIDSEEMGVFIIGCAGGRTSQLHIPITREIQKIQKSMHYFDLKICGLSGGHSGIDIHRGKGNAIKLLLRLLALLKDTMEFRLYVMDGGTAHNAIPREATAKIGVLESDISKFAVFCDNWRSVLQKEFRETDPNIMVTYVRSDEPTADWGPLTPESLQLFCDFGIVFPHGPLYYSGRYPKIVETSNNLALLKTESDHFYILSSQRSAVRSRLDELVMQQKGLAQLAGGSIKTVDGYPPWEPNYEANLLKLCLEIYESTFKSTAKVELIHAGLETGVIGEKYPNLSMISFGPTIEGAHSPEERLLVKDIKSIWVLLTALLKKLGS